MANKYRVKHFNNYDEFFEFIDGKSTNTFSVHGLAQGATPGDIILIISGNE